MPRNLSQQALIPPGDNRSPHWTEGPQFAEPMPTRDPDKFTVQHGSDKAAYSILDQQGKQKPRPYPTFPETEPVLKLADALGPKGNGIVSQIAATGQIVFHALGDTGNTHGPHDVDVVADKMVTDYRDTDPRSIPSFLYHLGDVVYSFGEEQYYYDQFYDPYRDYPAPIFAVAGNHDGMVAPNSSTPTLKAFLENFCTAGQEPHRTPEAGELSRTAQIQPGVYFTLETPFVRILGLYSNCLEDPGVISDQNGTYKWLNQAQVDFLEAALGRAKSENFNGGVIIAVHHPPYVAQTKPWGSGTRHGGSPLMLQDIDTACQKADFWPHAVLSGHAHNYQRFTRHQDGRETPFVVCGNGGHSPLQRLSHHGSPAIRVPVDQPSLALEGGGDSVTFESYDDQDFGYLRIIASAQQLRIEYHPAPDGEAAKTPDDFVTVDVATRKLIHYQVSGFAPAAAGSPARPRRATAKKAAGGARPRRRT